MNNKQREREANLPGFLIGNVNVLARAENTEPCADRNGDSWNVKKENDKS